MPALIEPTNIAALKELVGKDLPIGEWMTVTQEMINSFADATLDFQWIHIDVERATQHSPFKTPIAHGFLSLSLVPKLIAGTVSVKSAKMGVNYGVNKIRFPHHVPANGRLRLHLNVKEVQDYGDNGAKILWGCVLELEGAEKPACVGEFISLLFE